MTIDEVKAELIGAIVAHKRNTGLTLEGVSSAAGVSKGEMSRILRGLRDERDNMDLLLRAVTKLGYDVTISISLGGTA